MIALSLAVLWAGIAINTAAAVVAWHLNRRLNATLDHALALDRLLASLCLQAFNARHLPIWKAWAPAMGDINIEVTTTRRAP